MFEIGTTETLIIVFTILVIMFVWGKVTCNNKSCKK